VTPPRDQRIVLGPLDKLRWLQQIGADASVTRLALRLACALSDWFNQFSGEAWPPQEQLAQDLKATPRGVRLATAELVERGYLDVVVTYGKGHKPNVYRPRIAPIAGTPVPPKATFSRNSSALKAEETSSFRRKRPSPQPIEEPIEETIDSPRLRARESDPSGFEAWWSPYPRKVAKGAARKAYRKIVDGHRATPAELLAGCRRYAAERDGQDPRYTKHPATWLNGECWKDEATHFTPPATSSGLTGFASVLAGLAAIPDEGDER
jgi:hypothetical protein